MRVVKFLFAFLCIWPLTLAAQNSITGALVGTVTDISGAVLPGVSITVRNVDTGATRQVTSNGQGNYDVNLLEPGAYEIVASRSGFSTLELPRINVSVGQTQRANLSLKVGTTVTVEVDTAPSALNTESGSLGTVIESNEIEELPLNGRDFLQLANNVPGAVVNNPKTDVVGTSFDGARSTYNSYQIDGANSNDPEQNTLTTIPPLSSLEEFQVETSTYSARYGGAGGAQISVITKSGTNRFHGSAYDFLRNKVLDALPWDFNGPRNTAPNYLFNQFGGTIGGPVRRDRDFFFFNAEYLREKTPATRILTFSPNAAERSGDYTNSINPFTGAPVQLVDPYNNDLPYATAVLPPSRINQVGVTLLSLWPEPNIPNANPNQNLQIYRAGTDNFNRYLARFDHKFNQNNSVYATYDKDATDSVTTGDTPYSDIDNLNHGFTIAGHYLRLFSPTLTSDLTGNVAYYTTGSNYALANKNYGVAWGMDPSTNVINGSPWIVIFGQSESYFSFGGYVPPRHQNHSFNIQENIAWTRGNHSLQFGGSYGFQNYNWIYFSGMNQPYLGLLDGVASEETTFGSYGEPYADLLAALPDLNITYGGNGQYLPFHRSIVSAYLQDDWKVDRRLVLNLGVRWEYFQPFAVTNGEYETFDFTTGLPVFAKGAPGLGDISFPYENNGPNTPYNSNFHNFGPRMGFAYTPYASGRTVIRGGYGIYYVAEDAATMEQGTFENPFGGATAQYPRAFFWPDGMNHFNTLDQPPYEMNIIRGQTVGEAIWDLRNSPTTYNQQFNLTVGQELGKNTGLEIGYVGNHTVHAIDFMTLAEYDPAAQALLTKNIPTAAGNVYAKTGVSEFSSLQVKLRRSLSQNLTFLVAYTWGHALSTSSMDTGISENSETDLLQNGRVPPPIRSNADYDVRGRLSATSLYHLPFGRGQAFAKRSNGLTNAIIGGWSTALIFSSQSGFPYSVFDGTHILTDQVCNGKLAHPTPALWYDYNCFPTHMASTGTNPDGSTFQYNIQGDARPNIIYGPHDTNLDFGLHKQIDMPENTKLEFRAEAFNVLNHTELYSPNNSYFVNTASESDITSALPLRDIQFALTLSF